VPKTVNQKRYLNAMLKRDVVFGIGPAGTGKTYLAMAVALSHLIDGKAEKLIITRPAVEAGEALGFLPGDLQEKVLPYLRPLYDAMYDMLGKEDTIKLMERGGIEIAPLAYMRGRTLSNAFIILDEAQNTTNEQMMMFLTRLGDNSRMVITGDTTQIDLPKAKKSGLKHALNILKNVDGIKLHFLDETDVVRHPLVQKIIEAYQIDQDSSHSSAN
jgi:phosphate starvation-inducible PhoH-like protein